MGMPSLLRLRLLSIVSLSPMNSPRISGGGAAAKTWEEAAALACKEARSLSAKAASASSSARRLPRANTSVASANVCCVCFCVKVVIVVSSFVVDPVAAVTLTLAASSSLSFLILSNTSIGTGPSSCRLMRKSCMGGRDLDSWREAWR